MVDPKKIKVVNNWPRLLSPSDIAHIEDEKEELAKDVHQFYCLGVSLSDSNEGGILVHNGSESALVVDVKENQYMDSNSVELKKLVTERKIEVLSHEGD